MLGYHIRIRPRNSDHLGTTRQERRLVARSVLLRGARFKLVSFGLGEQHLHMYPICDRDGAGELSGQVSSSLIKPLKLEGGFEKPYIEPLKDMRHAYNNFSYTLGQEARHNIPADRAGEGSNLPDLLGFRLIGAYTLDNTRRYFPKIDRAHLLNLLGRRELIPANGPMDAIVDAGLAATALPSISGS
ncbi:MAG: hypothetical protein JRH20_23700 [Deltaproteobacteria bacterium]|nr:hypothetical protein [Deltaproteobacteria bacterium]